MSFFRKSGVLLFLGVVLFGGSSFADVSPQDRKPRVKEKQERPQAEKKAPKADLRTSKERLFSFEAAVVSDYMFRGLSQNDDSTAGQFSVNYEAPGNKLNFSIWYSEVDLSDSSAEIDIQAGTGFSFGDGRNVNFGVILYEYPGSGNYDYLELYAMLDIQDFFIGVNYSNDYFNETGDYRYVSVGWSKDINNFEWSAGAGYNNFSSKASYQKFLEVNSSIGKSSYWDWSLGVSYEFAEFDWKISYVGNDVELKACDDLCEEAFIFSVSKTF